MTLWRSIVQVVVWSVISVDIESSGISVPSELFNAELQRGP